MATQFLFQNILLQYKTNSYFTSSGFVSQTQTLESAVYTKYEPYAMYTKYEPYAMYTKYKPYEFFSDSDFASFKFYDSNFSYLKFSRVQKNAFRLFDLITL